jgi:hypothetical protein
MASARIITIFLIGSILAGFMQVVSAGEESETGAEDKMRFLKEGNYDDMTNSSKTVHADQQGDDYLPMKNEGHQVETTAGYHVEKASNMEHKGRRLSCSSFSCPSGYAKKTGTSSSTKASQSNCCEVTCASCLTGEIKSTLKKECKQSGKKAAKDAMKKQLETKFIDFLKSDDIDEAFSVVSNAAAAGTEDALISGCTECFDHVVSKLKKTKCGTPCVAFPFVTSIQAGSALKVAATALGMAVDEEKECTKVVKKAAATVSGGSKSGSDSGGSTSGSDSGGSSSGSKSTGTRRRRSRRRTPTSKPSSTTKSKSASNPFGMDDDLFLLILIIVGGCCACACVVCTCYAMKCCCFKRASNSSYAEPPPCPVGVAQPEVVQPAAAI